MHLDDHDHASARSRAVSRITSARSSRTPTIVASSTFRRGLRVTSEDSETLDSEERDDFDDPRIIDWLCVASRSTASFPFAFEASFVPVKEAPDDRPDMDGVASFEIEPVRGGRRCPCEPAAAARAPRDLRPARRTPDPASGGQVVPDPGEAMKETADDRPRCPSWRRSRPRVRHRSQPGDRQRARRPQRPQHARRRAAPAT